MKFKPPGLTQFPIYRGTPRHENGGRVAKTPRRWLVAVVASVESRIRDTVGPGAPWAPRLVAGLVTHAEQHPVRRPGPMSRTLTDDLQALRRWLVAEGVTHVCLESTGSYWKPVYNLPEDTEVVWLVNPSHIKPSGAAKPT